MVETVRDGTDERVAHTQRPAGFLCTTARQRRREGGAHTARGWDQKRIRRPPPNVALARDRAALPTATVLARRVTQPKTPER
jgi:hypothetical protein